MAQNPYSSPRAQVGDVQGEVGEAKFWSFSGRIGRMRYVAYSMAAMLVMFGVLLVLMMVTGGLAMAAGPDAGGFVGMLLIVPIYVVIFVISFMLAIQRSHDFNASGWLSLLILIPLANLIFLFIPGTQGRNNYGPPPPPNSVGVQVLFWIFIASLLILPILAAIAIPAYMGYVNRSMEGMPYEPQGYEQEQPLEPGAPQLSPEDFQQQLEQLQQELQQYEQNQAEQQPGTTP